jgi:hypothetical protein
MHKGFWWGNLRERDYLEELLVDGRVLLKWIFKNLNGGTKWIYLAQDRGRWRVVVNVVINRWSHKMRRISTLTSDLLASQEGFSPLRLVS